MIGSCDRARSLAAQAEAVFARQHHVENDEIDAMVGHRAEHLAAVGGRGDVAGVVAEIFCDQSPRFAVIFDEKNVR